MGGILKVLASKHSMARFDIDYTLIRDSDFSKAKLEYCFFSCGTRFLNTNFKGVLLENCKFDSSFSECDFRYSAWEGIDAYESKFEDCLFINVCFRNCNLRRTRYRGCTFLGCSFIDCDISLAQFTCSSSMVRCTFIRCDLDRVRLPEVFVPDVINESKSVPYIPMVCPDEGEIIGYKKAWSVDDGLRYPVLVTLRIPADARRSSGYGRKCRCDKATVVKMEWVNPILHVYSNPNVTIARSVYDENFVYTEGKEVTPRNGFCEDRWDVCSGGIHFFMNKQEAIEY